MACGAGFYSCRCSLEAAHEGPHVCECNGSWADNGTIHGWPEEYVGPPEGRVEWETVKPLLDDLCEMLSLPGPSFTKSVQTTSEPKA